MMKTLIIILLTAFSLTAAAQKGDPDFLKFGKVSDIDFQHTDLDDMGYDAVILQNEKSMYFDRYNEDLRLYNVHHIRLKVLKDGFYDDELFTIPYSGRYEYERVIGIKCWIFSDKNSKPHKVKYKNFKHINRDSLESRVELHLPALRAGDVLDLEYTLLTYDFVLPPIWRTNCKYPCRASRLTTNFPNFMEYKYDPKGAYADDIVHTAGTGFISINYSLPHGRPVMFKFQANLDTFKIRHTLPVEMYESQHVSPLYGTSSVRMRAAKFTQNIGYNGGYLTVWQYLTHLLYVYADPDNRELSRQEARHQFYPAGYVIVSSNNWPRLHKRQRKSSEFWKPLLKAVTMPDELRDIMDPDEPLDTIAATRRIYDYVRNTMAWDSTYNNHISRSVEKILKSRRGNLAEINMALVSLLRHAGIPAYTAMASTKDFGEVDTAYANTVQFNAVLACVPYEQHLILMDATASGLPLGRIPRDRYDRVMWALSPETWYFVETDFDADGKCDPKKMLDGF